MTGLFLLSIQGPLCHVARLYHVAEASAEVTNAGCKYVSEHNSRGDISNHLKASYLATAIEAGQWSRPPWLAG